jgi:Ca2+-transporting ATPase
VWEVPGKQESHLVAVKGAPEAVVDLCHLEAAQQTIVLDSAHAMAQRGLRVLGVARATYPTHAWPSSQHDFAFEFLGLIALSDPLRPEAITAIRDCRAAGIRVAMITGDFASTAQSIAAQAGLDTQGAVLTGVEVAALDDAQLQDKVANTTVFARVLPEQKLRIVNAFKARGEVVAMTGDGVNDAPSLKAAHIGIAMGKRGTHVAREASALVLLDDDFSAIVRAIRLGRRIYDNLRKAMAFVLAVHVPIAGLSLLPLLVGLPIVFMPVHIAFLELVIDPVASFVFEAEEEETDVMQRPPRDPKAPLFSSSLMGWSVLQGVAILICTGILYAVLLSQGHAPDQARAATFTALVMANFGLIVVNRSFAPLDAQVLLRPNKALLRIFAATIALLAAALGIPLARELFHFGELTLSLLAVALGVSLGTTALLEMLKRLGLSELLPTAWRLGR